MYNSKKGNVQFCSGITPKESLWANHVGILFYTLRYCATAVMQCGKQGTHMLHPQTFFRGNLEKGPGPGPWGPFLRQNTGKNKKGLLPSS